MYLVLIFVLVVGILLIRLFKSGPSSRKTEAVFSGIMIFLFSALRDESVGIDLHSYTQGYIDIALWSVNDIIFHSEGYMWSTDTVFWIFLKMLTYFSSDPQLMIVVISAFIAYSVAFLAYRTNSDILVCVILFITLRYFSFTMSGIRQALAMSLIFLSVKFIEEKRFKPFLLLTIIASLIHGSALFFVFAYPITKIKNIKTILVPSLILISTAFLFTGTFISIMSYIPFLGNRFEGYLNFGSQAEGSAITSIYLIVLFFSLIKRKQISSYILNGEKKHIASNTNDFLINKTILYFNLLIVGVSIALIGVFVPNLFRVGYYFIIPSLIYMFPWAIEFYQNLLGKLPIKFIAILLLVMQFTIIGPGAGVDEYKFFWESNIVSY